MGLLQTRGAACGIRRRASSSSNSLRRGSLQRYWHRRWQRLSRIRVRRTETPAPCSLSSASTPRTSYSTSPLTFNTFETGLRRRIMSIGAFARREIHLPVQLQHRAAGRCVTPPARRVVDVLRRGHLHAASHILERKSCAVHAGGRGRGGSGGRPGDVAAHRGPECYHTRLPGVLSTAKT